MRSLSKVVAFNSEGKMKRRFSFNTVHGILARFILFLLSELEDALSYQF
jgi:hypothetical protein